MQANLREFIARRVFHPLEGMTFGEWWRILQLHQFAIDLNHWPRALVQTAVSVSNSVAARLERRRFGAQIDSTNILEPIFILGHYRSGTTHLHNLLALDTRLAAPTFFQVLNPHTFLTTERWAAPFAGWLMVSRRFQDSMALSPWVPSEDEVAICTMTGLSSYMGYHFPRAHRQYRRYVSLRGVPDDELRRWERALTTFLKKLTLRYGCPLVLKSPPHTGASGSCSGSSRVHASSTSTATRTRSLLQRNTCTEPSSRCAGCRNVLLRTKTTWYFAPTRRCTTATSASSA